MKIGIKLALLGIVSMLIGTAFASPLLLSELDIVPFPRAPEGPKADFSITVEYANFTVHEQASNLTSGGYNLSIVDYSIVFNVTNHSDLKAELAGVDFSAAKDIELVPSALGGYSANSGSGKGKGKGGFVKGLWLDGEWLNTTWVPDGGLDEIFGEITTTNPQIVSLYEEILPKLNISVPVLAFGMSRPIIEGTNYWLEGVPLHEYIYNNEVVVTLIYTNGSWIDVTGRVEVIEKPYVSITNFLLNQMLMFRETSEGTVSQSHYNPYVYSGVGGFNNTLMPGDSRLILISGSTDVGAFWDGVESLKAGEITLYSQSSNYVLDNIVNGTYVDTSSSATELKTIQLEINGNQYVYNSILSDDQIFATDEFGVEVFIEGRN